MKNITLGTTGITVPQNGFGALPVQRADVDTAVEILRAAYKGGMRFFDTARAYSDSEEKMGLALADVRKEIYIATSLQFIKQQVSPFQKFVKNIWMKIWSMVIWIVNSDFVRGA